MEYLSLDEIKQIELNILEYISNTCTRLNLRYYIYYGTLIGAIRHKGFIPWDDDIDIMMPRPDYEKLLDYLYNHPHQRYKPCSIRDKRYFYGFAKIVDNNTRIINSVTDESPDQKIWIDIFPYDGMKSPHSFNNRLCFILNKLKASAIYKNYPKGKSGNYITWKITRIIGYRPFLFLYEKLCKRYDYDTSKYVGLISDAKDYYPKELLEKSCNVIFEGKTYKAPTEYDKILRNYYGDYMQLPPEEKRISHKIEAIIDL